MEKVKSHISLSQFNQEIKSVLQRSMAPSYWVVAEIAEMRIHGAGHCYLNLVEKKGSQFLAQIRATIWAYTFRNLSAWFKTHTGSDLANGMKVLVKLEVQFHEVYGISANILDLDPNYTLGERARKRKETIDQLQADGIFDLNKEHLLPTVPQRIAIISAENAAGFGDFRNQIKNNIYGYSITGRLFPSVMQGQNAPESIIKALMSIYDRVEEFDVVVIIRGGGAQTDLDCFDDYDLCAHIAQFPLPILTGIGHERDETIADLVAHTKLKTPTAVAEFLIEGFRSYEENVLNLVNTISQNAGQRLQQDKDKLQFLSNKLQISATGHIRAQEKYLEQLYRIIPQKAGLSLQRENLVLEGLKDRLLKAPKRIVDKEQQKLEWLQKNIQLLDPKQLLKRGYSMTTFGGKVLSEQNKPEKGDVIQTRTANYTIESTVN
ncbi:exodeoxyribonuclease VII large subunit [Persicobacter sp. CCB-QB2]|uniref:exodeoxyribonuclease VII large subunit n=1 Tax=Persicobacter sp. CCB-QB2 TaxID=1561025 RepID=UPI0006A9EC46|nr:exodeoxyribonuclease VII large subunit [Persicobacter sp. CCB-QB2]